MTAKLVRETHTKTYIFDLNEAGRLLTGSNALVHSITMNGDGDLALTVAAPPEMDRVAVFHPETQTSPPPCYGA